MISAIFSDIHDNRAGLRRVLRDAERQQADRFICLGDVGHSLALYADLAGRGIECTFGNWEVSGLRQLPAPAAGWIRRWPAVIRTGSALCCHATPDLPDRVQTTDDAARFMATAARWHVLFPRLNHDELARWQALAKLQSDDLSAVFHGHTHVQEVWAWADDGTGTRQLRSFRGPADLVLDPGPAHAPSRYLIGVGSAGQPHDGPQPRYVLFDDVTGVVQLRRLSGCSPA